MKLTVAIGLKSFPANFLAKLVALRARNSTTLIPLP